MSILVLISFLQLQTLCVSGSSLGQQVGEGMGYALIILISLVTFSTGLMILLKPSNKGIAASLLQLIIFLQYTRYTVLINFTDSVFYVCMWKTFNIIQDPYDFCSSGKSIEPFSTIGFGSTNFICNSMFQFILIFTVLLFWFLLSIIMPRIKSKRWKDFLIFLVYASVIDLSISAFLQVYYVILI